MRLATLRDGTRDGRLVVVDQNFVNCRFVHDKFKTLQSALDNWQEAKPELLKTVRLVENKSNVFPFDINNIMAPLPRAYQWIDGSAYLSHVELVRKARNAAMPANYYQEPLMYQGGSDSFIGPRDPILVADESYGIDFEAEVAVIVDDVPMGASPEVAKTKILLIMLVNDITLRNLIPTEYEKGFGFLQSKITSAFSPIAVTPDEFGEYWDGNKLNVFICADVNKKPTGKVVSGRDMTFDFPQLIAHAAKTRVLSAGTIIGSGTVSMNQQNTGEGEGFCCLAEVRANEALSFGVHNTSYLKFGDTIRIWAQKPNGDSMIGEIVQQVQQY